MIKRTIHNFHMSKYKFLLTQMYYYSPVSNMNLEKFYEAILKVSKNYFL